MPDQLSQLRSRVSRALSGTTVEAAGQRMRAIVGPVPEGDAKLAIDKLEQGQIPTPQELAALEMLVRLMRPAPLCQGGLVGNLPADNHAFPDWAAFQQAVRPYLYCIGRIDSVAPENIGARPAGLCRRHRISDHRQIPSDQRACTQHTFGGNFCLEHWTGCSAIQTRIRTDRRRGPCPDRWRDRVRSRAGCCTAADGIPSQRFRRASTASAR